MSVYNFEVKSILGENVKLDKYKGKVLLIVNTASECGFTPQYDGLEELYKKFHQKGFEVLGFPCNQFGGQEPGEDAKIMEFCRTHHGVSFPMFSKIDVNGDAADPLYKYLKKEEKGLLGTEAIKWNFTKFLIDKNGEPVKRYAPQVKPAEIENDIQKLLG